jgi:hypothetical protein
MRGCGRNIILSLTLCPPFLYDYRSVPTTASATQYPRDNAVAGAKRPAEQTYYYGGHPQQQSHEMSAVHEMPSSLQAMELPGTLADRYPGNAR